VPDAQLYEERAMNESLTDRVKIDVRVPKSVLMDVDTVAAATGLNRNAFYLMAIMRLCIELSRRYVPGRRRLTMLKNLEREFQKLFEEAREGL
jgi:hypothetical protein